VKDFIAHSAFLSYRVVIALEHALGRSLFRAGSFGGRAMLPPDPYRDVLVEHERGHHFVTSAWIIVAVLAVLMVMFV
jgi:hypothetical protein